MLKLAEQRGATYAYSLDRVATQAERLKGLESIDRVYYAIKANSNPGVLRRVRDSGLEFECVSPGEIRLLRELFPEHEPGRILFTPNFAARSEYGEALEAGVQLTVDNLGVLRDWPELFDGREILLRLDPGVGRGLHRHVRTAGVHSKFGVPLFEVQRAAEAASAAGARITGLHAHMGSGVMDPGAWTPIAESLLECLEHFPDVRVVNLGGGLGVPQHGGEQGLDLAELDANLARCRENAPRELEFWLEPGRFVVAEAGVLLARVTQVKGKTGARYVGVETGMNSLIRPALYGSFHEVHNLSRLEEPATRLANVVGPICESGDVLARDRMLPECREGDVLLFANAGAYGHVMASNYNLREPAAEEVIEVSSEGKRASADFLLELEAVIRSRAEAAPQESYTARLLGEGIQRVAQKFGEEAVELALAAAAGDPRAVRAEAADVLYHLLVLLEGAGVSLSDVLEELRSRR